MTPSSRSRCASIVLLACAACSTAPIPPKPLPTVAPAWSAPLPHGGKESRLADWWSDFDDPAIGQLVDAAQRDNPTLEQAAARVREARAALAQAGAARVPSVTANASASRADTPVAIPSGSQTVATITMDASWELDLFGRVRAGAAAAEARERASALAWHDARVTLAAEVAAEYVSLRACEALVGVFEQDVASQSHTADLTLTKVRGGFEAPANGALAAASAADASTRLIAQRADCEISVKTLAYLTGVAEPDLRGRLAARAARLPQPAGFAVGEVPARVIAQRPDLASTERELAAAAADIDAAQADRFPRVTLTGSIGYGRAEFAGLSASGSSWSFGPALSLPVFDAGRRLAAVDAARARFDGAAARYRESARRAVREVEQALVGLDAATRREDGARRASEGYRAFFSAAEQRWRVGTGSLLDLEQARRNALSADATLIQVRRDRVAAWITLYKAVGGGWSADASDPARG